MNVTTLFAQLENDWETTLATTTHHFGALGSMTGNELRELIQNSPTSAADRNALLRTLIELERSGHSHAGRVLLQTFTPLAVSAARYYRTLGTGADWSEACQLAVTTLWELIKWLPETRYNAISGNLKMDLRKRLSALATAERNDSERQMCDEWWSFTTDSTHLVEDMNTNHDDSNDLIVLLAWAFDQEILTAEQIRLLARIELTGDPHTIRDDTAAELGISRRSLDRRVARIRAHLVRVAAARVAADS